jgi:uncharacterized protein with PQ loop repeat
MPCRAPKEANVHLSLSSWVGLVGTILAFLSVVPQARKLRRATSAAGVSVAGLATSVVSGLGWTYFGLVRHDIWVALPAAVTVPPAMYAGLRAYGREGDRERLWLPVMWAGVVTIAAVSVRWLGDAPLTLVLGFSVVFMVGPAAWTVWTSAELSAISRSAWYWLIAEASLTGTYGYLAQIDASLLYAAVAIAGSMFIVARVSVADGARAPVEGRPGTALRAAHATSHVDSQPSEDLAAARS